jgi:hypothetical protein
VRENELGRSARPGLVGSGLIGRPPRKPRSSGLSLWRGEDRPAASRNPFAGCGRHWQPGIQGLATGSMTSSISAGSMRQHSAVR